MEAERGDQALNDHRLDDATQRVPGENSVTTSSGQHLRGASPSLRSSFGSVASSGLDPRVRMLAMWTIAVISPACATQHGQQAARWGAQCESYASPAQPTLREPREKGVRLVAWTDLPKSDVHSAELSSLAWSDKRGTLFAISDEALWIVSLTPSRDWEHWCFGSVIPVSVPALSDTEGLALTSSGFLVASENGPRVVELDEKGKLIRERVLPAHFKRAHHNRSLESVALSPSGRMLATANEEALEGDGPAANAEHGSVVRVFTTDLVTGAKRESAYRTDPVFASGADGENGLVDLAFIDDQHLLVLERAYVPEVGNAVRLYRTTLGSSPDVLGTSELPSDVETMPKELLVDLASLDDSSFPETNEPQPTRLLENYEGMALGPATSEGSHLLFLVSDDNGRTAQFARLLVLEAPL